MTPIILWVAILVVVKETSTQSMLLLSLRGFISTKKNVLFLAAKEVSLLGTTMALFKDTTYMIVISAWLTVTRTFASMLLALRFHTLIRLTVPKAAALANNLLKSTVCCSQDFVVTLFKFHKWPMLEYRSCVWNTGYLFDLKLLESGYHRWTKQTNALQDCPTVNVWHIWICTLFKADCWGLILYRYGK